MNKHLSQPASQGIPPDQLHRTEQTSNSTKKNPTHGASTQSIFKTNPNQQNQQQNTGSSVSHAEVNKQHHDSNETKTSGSHPQK
ncbi:hypothetical protein BGX26_004861, partial [Mortierella sp. AD094]